MLIHRYAPKVLYGFDPLLEQERVGDVVGGTVIELHRAAAWVKEGYIELGVGARELVDATVLPEKNDRDEWSETVAVPCFDLARWLDTLGVPVILKMNIEGAEYTLIEHLIDTQMIGLVEQLVVAWHDDRLGPEFTERRRKIERRIDGIPMRDWTVKG